jgi:hypothetical protein
MWILNWTIFLDTNKLLNQKMDLQNAHIPVCFGWECSKRVFDLRLKETFSKASNHLFKLWKVKEMWRYHYIGLAISLYNRHTKFGKCDDNELSAAETENLSTQDK